jgi:hypothetical protein
MTNYQKALKSVRHLQEEYKRTDRSMKPSAFIDYCENIFTLVDLGRIDRREAGYVIADMRFDDAVSSNSDLEAIALQAGNLELPDDTISGEPTEEWDKLRQWVEEAKIKYRKQ